MPPPLKVCRLCGIWTNRQYFSIPKDEDIGRQWREALGLQNGVPYKNYRICINHFAESDIRPVKMGSFRVHRTKLRENAVPTLNLTRNAPDLTEFHGEPITCKICGDTESKVIQCVYNIKSRFATHPKWKAFLSRRRVLICDRHFRKQGMRIVSLFSSLGKRIVRLELSDKALPILEIPEDFCLDQACRKALQDKALKNDYVSEVKANKLPQCSVILVDIKSTGLLSSSQREVVAKNLTEFDDGQPHVKVEIKREEEEAVNETSSFSAQTMFVEQNLLPKSELKEEIPDTEDVLDQSFECSPTKLEEP